MNNYPLTYKRTRYMYVSYHAFKNFEHLSEEEEAVMMTDFIKYIHFACRMGYIVVSNDLDLINFTHISHMYLPSNLPTFASRMQVDEGKLTSSIRAWETLARHKRVSVSYIAVSKRK